MDFINKTNISNNIFNDLVNNILSRMQIDCNIKIFYVNSINNVKDEGLYIIKENNINKEKIIYFNKFFIFDVKKYKYNIFYEYENIPLVYKYQNKYILSFDIFTHLQFIIFQDLFFIKEDFFQIPFMEYLLKQFENIIFTYCKELKINIKKKSNKRAGFLATFDIDRVQYFSFYKTLFYFFAKSVSKKKKYSLYFELKNKYKKDIWDNIEQILEILRKRKIRALFFIMMKNRDKFGRRYSFNTARKIIETIEKEHNIGLHLSYESGENIEEIKKEIKKFNTINKCKFVRYHYLYELQKKHYEELKKNNIVMDSSTGFRNKCGFKKGFSKEYIIPGYSIIEIPVICMDSAYNIQKLQNKQYSLEKIMQEIINTNGIFTFIFHQSTLNKETFGYEYILNDFFKIIKEYKLNSINIEELLNL